MQLLIIDSNILKLPFPDITILTRRNPPNAYEVQEANLTAVHLVLEARNKGSCSCCHTANADLRREMPHHSEAS